MPLTVAQARKAALALHRFGFGPKPGVIERIGADPLAALHAELTTPGIARVIGPGLPNYETAAGKEAALASYAPLRAESAIGRYRRGVRTSRGAPM